MPGVSIEAVGPSLQGARKAASGANGVYRIPALPPGEYRVRASLDAFRPAEKMAVVRLDATATADFELEPAAAEDVVVTGSAPLVDAASAATGTNYTSSVIAHLPVDRNYADIVKANPGVSTDRGATAGRSLAITIYGATSTENQWIIDGVNTTNVFKGVQGKAINNEFVQEVEVKTGGYQAEYGRALGGVINVITKSGGNELHGDAFAYYDSTGTAAEQQFRPGDSGIARMLLDTGERFDYGADLGGFLVKDRLWFFGAYNRVTLNTELSRAQASTHVTTEDRFPLESTSNLYSGKLTWNAPWGMAAVGTVFADPSRNSGAAGADPRQGLGDFDVTPPVSTDPSTWYSTRTQGGADFGIRLTQLFGSRTIAAVQGSYHRDRNELTADPTIRYIDNTCSGGSPEDACPFPSEPNDVRGGYGLVNAYVDHDVSSRKQVAGSVVVFSGDHELKGGGDYQDGRTDGLFYYSGGQQVALQNEYGQAYYQHEFFAVSTTDPTRVSGWAPRARVVDYGLYLQDSWRAARGLTVNVGLRWDGETVHDYAGRAVLRFDDEWQPRIGLVWDPWHDGATKVFASVGRFSYALPTVAAAGSFADFTRLLTFNFDPVSTAQDTGVLNHEETVLLFGGAYGDSVDAGVRAPFQDEATIGVERLIGSSLTIGLKGTYRSLGRALEDRCDFQSGCALINPGSDARFASGDAPTCNGLYDNDEWFHCQDAGPPTPEARRYYRGLELLARETLGRSLWIQASYVYSSLRGNYDGGVNEGAFGQTSPTVNSDFDYPALWHEGFGTMALDRTHRFRLDAYWVTPWRLTVGLQGFAASGAPLNKRGFFNSGYGGAIYLLPRGSAGRLPTLWDANLTLGYPIAIGPTTVTLQAYLFNVFNNQIAIARDDVWSSSPPEGFPATIYDPDQEQTNPYYGAVTQRSAPRTLRVALRISF